MFNLKHLFIIYFIISLLIKKYKELHTTYDIVTRLDINMFFWDLFYFSWTNISYIFTIQLVFILSVYLLVYLPKIKCITHYVLLLYIFIAVIYLTYNLNLSFSINYPILKLDYYNVLLSNSLNKYHPFILYSAWVTIFILFIVSSSIYTKHYTYHYINHNFNIIINALFFTVFTLFLGSWWAYQEGSWGGWWNWDPSEVFGLYIMLILTIFIHIISINNSTYLRRLIIYLGLTSSLIYYSFMQINFSLISHNFGFRDSDLVDIRIFYFNLLSLLSALLLFLFTKLLKLNSYISFSSSNNNYAWYKLITSLLVSTIIFASCFILLNDLIWKVTKINFSNLILNYNTLLFFVFITYYTLNIDLAAFYIIIYLLFWQFNAESIFIIFLLTSTFSSIFLNVHLLILFSILITLISCRFYLTSWMPLKFLSLQYTTDINYLFNYTFSLQYPFLIENFNFYNFITHTIYLSSTSPDSKIFNLISSNNTVIQSLISDHAINIYAFLSYDKAVVYLLTTTLLYLITTRLLSLKYRLILI